MSVTPIAPLRPLHRPSDTSALAPAPVSGAGAFEQALSRILGGAASADAQAAQAVQDLAAGEADDVHTAALAVAQADLSFRLALAVRNRLLDAYQEVIRLQV